MTSTLSAQQVADYQRDGFLTPLNILTEAEAQALRAEIEAMEARYTDGTLPTPLNQFFRVNGHIVLPLMADVPQKPAILDAVESILVPTYCCGVVSCSLRSPEQQKL